MAADAFLGGMQRSAFGFNDRKMTAEQSELQSCLGLDEGIESTQQLSMSAVSWTRPLNDFR